MLVRDLGLIEYSEGLRIQTEMVGQVITGRKPAEIILVCEHPTVITVGRGLGSEGEVHSKKIPIHEVSRGGRSTLHLPGQLVVYPILDLTSRGRDLHEYLRKLEWGIIDTLADFRIESKSIPEKTGVWVSESRRGSGEHKIASLGIAVKQWVSYHGLALNVSPDLSVFKNLNPCGFKSDVMTSMMEEMPPEYKSTWALDPVNLMARVKLRLIENIKARLEELDGAQASEESKESLVNDESSTGVARRLS